MAHLQGMDSSTKRGRVLKLAQAEGIKAGAVAGTLASAGVAALTKFSPWFKKSTSVSAKTALAVSPFFLAYFLRTELVMHGANLDPHAYGLTDEGRKTIAGKESRHELSFPHKAANWLYLNPFKMIAGMGVPAVGGILYSMRNEGNLKLSQKLMHTRVYGQMTVLSLLVCTMTFQEVMRRNGGLFVISTSEEPEGGEDEEGGEAGGVVAVAVASNSS